MKKVISLCAVVMFGVTAFAQDTTSRFSTGKDSAQRMGDSTMSQTQTHLKRDSAVTTSAATDSSVNKNQQAQQQTTVADSTAKVIPTDRVIMKDDKMYMVKSGDSTVLDKSYKLESGAVVSATGSVKYPSGRTVQLKNGQFIELKKAVTTETKKTTSVTKKKVS